MHHVWKLSPFFIALLMGGMLPALYAQSYLSYSMTPPAGFPNLPPFWVEEVQDPLALVGYLNYDFAKIYASRRQVELRYAYQSGKVTMDEVRIEFTTFMLNNFIGQWRGADCAENSISSHHRACFISTTLQDVGFRIDRDRFAWQAPDVAARTLNLGHKVLKMNADSPLAVVTQLQKFLQEGLYFIGSDNNHIGYLNSRAGELSVIYSSDTKPCRLEGQSLEEWLGANPGTIYIADLTWNDRLLEYWLEGKEIPLK